MRREGKSLGLQEKPLQILLALLENPGVLVSREELRHRLWPNDAFLGFDEGLNTAVRKLRQVLVDSADAPRYIETIPKRGYRFIATVDFAPEGELDGLTFEDTVVVAVVSSLRSPVRRRFWSRLS